SAGGGGRGRGVPAGTQAAQGRGGPARAQARGPAGRRRLAAADGDRGGAAGLQGAGVHQRDRERRAEDLPGAGPAGGARLGEGALRGAVVGAGLQRGPFRPTPARVHVNGEKFSSSVRTASLDQETGY